MRKHCFEVFQGSVKKTYLFSQDIIYYFTNIFLFKHLFDEAHLTTKV